MILMNIGCVAPPAKVEYIESPEYFEFDDFGEQIWHFNSRGNITGPLDWSDVKALSIDSVTVKYLEYNPERYLQAPEFANW